MELVLIMPIVMEVEVQVLQSLKGKITIILPLLAQIKGNVTAAGTGFHSMSVLLLDVKIVEPIL